MLKRRRPPARSMRASQQGVVLLVALVVLVALTVAGVAMMRSVDTATLVTGNLAFEEVATQAADQGIQAAMDLLADRKDHNLLADPAPGYSPTLHIEDSWKYSVEDFHALAHGAGFRTLDHRLDSKELFSLHLLEAG